MAIEAREEIIQRLETATTRMFRIRRAAHLAGVLIRGGEPAPVQPPGELGDPGAGFVGQPPRPSPPAR